MWRRGWKRGRGGEISEVEEGENEGLEKGEEEEKDQLIL